MDIFCIDLFPNCRQEYETPVLPRGFIFQISILSTWGDAHYVGLNGLQFFDETAHILSIDPKSECTLQSAYESLALEGIDLDNRRIGLECMH